MIIITKHTRLPPASVKKKNKQKTNPDILKLWILFQPLSCVLQKVLSIPILICEHLFYNKGWASWYFITFKKFWYICFKIIWLQTRNGWYCLTYCQIKYHGSRFMSDLCHNQSYDRTGCDALTLKVILLPILEKLWKTSWKQNYMKNTEYLCDWGEKTEMEKLGVTDKR